MKVKEWIKINNTIEKMPDGNYYCDICDLGFKKKSECFSHIKSEHGGFKN